MCPFPWAESTYTPTERVRLWAKDIRPPGTNLSCSPRAVLLRSNCAYTSYALLSLPSPLSHVQRHHHVRCRRPHWVGCQRLDPDAAGASIDTNRRIYLRCGCSSASRTSPRSYFPSLRLYLTKTGQCAGILLTMDLIWISYTLNILSFAIAKDHPRV